MPKITRHGGPSNAAEQLRALGKLGPYGQPAQSTPEPEPVQKPAMAWMPDPEADSPWAAEADTEPDMAEPDAAPLDPAAAVDNAAVRAWAAEQGIEVAARGKIPRHVIDRYLAAHEG